MKFRNRMNHFIEKLVAKGGVALSSSNKSSGRLLQDLVDWLSVLGSSDWLAFRHTSALFTGHLIQSLMQRVLKVGRLIPVYILYVMGL